MQSTSDTAGVGLPSPGTSPASLGWELFPHGADVGVRGFGPTVEAAFEQAAIALTAVVTEPETVGSQGAIAVECEAPDLELLFVAWLNALIYEMAVRRMLFGRFAVRTDGHRLFGQAWGETVDRDRHGPATEPKGATLTALEVRRRSNSGWVAQCVVDV